MGRSAAFRNVALGILALALAYSVGRASPLSVSPGAGTVYYAGGNYFAAVVGRTLYVNGAPHGGPIPGTAAAVAIGPGVGYEPLVMLADGDVWFSFNGGWQYQGNALGAAPTGAARATFGQVKARYR